MVMTDERSPLLGDHDGLAMARPCNIVPWVPKPSDSDQLYSKRTHTNGYHSQLEDNCLAVVDHPQHAVSGGTEEKRCLTSQQQQQHSPLMLNSNDHDSPSTSNSSKQSKNSSLVTVFAIWNGIMGTSLLAMPWVFQQSGLVATVLAFLFMCMACVFTAYRVLTMHACLRRPLPVQDFKQVMSVVLSRHWEYCGIVFSIGVMLGAMLVYYVLMSDFLFNSVQFFLSTGGFTTQVYSNRSVIYGAYCPQNDTLRSRISPDDVNPVSNSPVDLYQGIWNHTTAPLFLVPIVFPILNIKSPTFFTKFTGLGIISVIYMATFVTIKSSQFGIHASFSDPSAIDFVGLFRPNFPVVMGTLSMAMFIHSCIGEIMENNRHPEHNVRDLLIAYFLVCITYFYIGVVFFLAWPFAKSCIRENLLDNFIDTDLLSAVARVFLMFQLYTLFPLLGFMIRSQLMMFIYGTAYPGAGRVLLLNACLVLLCVIITIFYPYIGQLTRFSGALCGMAWVFTFPCLVYLVGTYRNGQLRWPAVILHGSIIVLGAVNLILQFTVSTE